MKPLVKQKTSSEMSLWAAEVRGCHEGKYVVFLGQALSTAERAAGCLLEPEAGDTVLTAASEDGRIFILSVLTRSGMCREAKVSVPGSAMMIGGDEVLIQAEKELGMSAPRFLLNADNTEASVGICSVKGGEIVSRFRRVVTVAQTMETIAERAVERLGRCYRRVIEFEEAQIGRMRLAVAGLFKLSAKSASLKSEKRIMLDAEKIHLG